MAYRCPVATCKCLFQAFDKLQAHHRDSHDVSLAKQDELHYRIIRDFTVDRSQEDDKTEESRLAIDKEIMNEYQLPGHVTKTKNKSSGQKKVYPNRCRLCTRTFLCQIDRDRHEAQHNVLTHICSCGGAYRNFGNLKLHRLKDHGKALTRSEENSYRLPSSPCGSKPGPIQTNLRRKLRCRYCPKIFYTHSSRSLHEKAHEKMSYECHCGFRCAKFVNFRCHYHQVHKIRLPFQYEKMYRSKDNKPAKSEDQRDDNGSQTTGKDKVDTKINLVEKSQHRTKPSVAKSGGGSYHPKCSLCLRTFQSNKDRQEHEETHNLMAYQCPPPCGAAFLHFANLKRHCTVRHNVKILDTEKDAYKIKENCSDDTLNKNHTDVSATGHSEKQLSAFKSGKIAYVCPRCCGGAFSSFDLFREHYLKIHKRVLIVHKRKKIPVGKSAFLKGQNLFTNQFSDHTAGQQTVSGNRKRYRPICKMCQRQFPSNKERNHHEIVHDQMKYKCPQPCGGAFPSFSALRRHSQLTHGTKNLSQCENSYKIQEQINGTMLKKYTINQSTKNVHKENCGTGKILKQQLLKSQKIKRSRPKCNICHRRFTLSRERDLHELQHHKMTHKCPTCGYEFLNLVRLKLHYRAVHKRQLSEQDEVNCRIIESGKSDTGSNKQIQYANETHTQTGKEEIVNEVQTKNSVPKLTLLRNGEGTFEVATASDHKQSSENLHKEVAIQRKHKGRHWTCQICQRKFNTEDAKDLHESKHDLMKFKCPDPCPNMFINFPKLRAHTKKKHHFILTHINRDVQDK